MATTKGTWSISAIARESGRDRRSVQAALRSCPAVSEKPIGDRIERRFELGAVLRHLLARQATGGGTTSTDADGEFLDRGREQALLWREQRRTKELDNGVRQGQLIPAAEVETEMAAVIKSFVAFLEQIPDVLERDANISGAAVERLQAIVDRERQKLYEQMLARIDDTGTTTP